MIMRTHLLFLFILFLSANTIVSGQKVNAAKENKFSGTYIGLNENAEFEFIADNGKIYTFQEIGEDVIYDLYEEQLYKAKFEVQWISQIVEILDEEGDPTGEKEQITVIVFLKKL
jgi:hypothetical protein